MAIRPIPQPSQAAPTIALILQGGGALGAYHIGAYQALAEHGLHPDWVSGISIGAINAAVIAGNPPEERVQRLAAFWEAISWPELPTPPLPPELQTLRDAASYGQALLIGQPHFFVPRLVNPWLVPSSPPETVSFYDVAPLLPTLRQFADFALINRRSVRLSLGATNLATGEQTFFDNHRQALGPEHVLASGSLPPGFPATLVDGTPYWDGACVSNSPLDAIVDEPAHPRMLVFLLDLWDPAGPLPRTMNDVLWRTKQIQYASRAAYHVDAAANKVNLRQALALLKAPQAAPTDPALSQRLDIVHIVYRPGTDEIANSDAEFSRSSIAARRAAGYHDMQVALQAQPWQAVPAHLGAQVHKVEHGTVATQPSPISADDAPQTGGASTHRRTTGTGRFASPELPVVSAPTAEPAGGNAT